MVVAQRRPASLFAIYLMLNPAWLSKGTNARAIRRRPRKAKVGVTYFSNKLLLPLTLTMFGQVLSSRAENPFSFPAGQPKIEQVVLCKSREQPIACQVRELGRGLGFLARRLSHGPVAPSWHFRLVANSLAEIVSFFQHIEPNTGLVAEDRPKPRLDSRPAPSQLRLMRRPDHRMAVERDQFAPFPVFLPIPR